MRDDEAGMEKGVERIEQNMTGEEFSRLVRQYERLVYTICYQFVKDHQLAEDLTQETFLSAYTHRGDCPPGSYKPWLARIAANKAKDHLKSAYHRHVSAAGEEELPLAPGMAEQMQPEDIAVAKDEAVRIRDTILALKEPYHQVAVQFFLEEKKVEEIAAALKRPPKTVHTQIYRAKLLLQGALERGNQNGAVQ